MNTNNFLAIASFSPNSLELPNAWVAHLPFAAWLIKEISPGIFVELGTHSGNSYFAFCQAVAESRLSTTCYAVDTWQGDEYVGCYGDEVFHKVYAHHQERYAGFSRLLRMTFDDAVNYFADESIELLHIDGLHTYEAVKHDFETWLPKLAPGAVVLFHDTNVREHGFGVRQLWEELQARYPLNMEFVHSHGLGVLQLGNGPTDKQLPWLLSGAPRQQLLRDYFAALGARQVERHELNDIRRTVAERDGQIAELNRLVRDKDVQINNLGQLLAERDRVVQTLCASASWRITRPLREMKSWIERTAGSTRVDAAWYLQQNPDVVKSGMDPSVHYVTFGKAEGRQPAPDAVLKRSIRTAQRIRAALLVTVQRRGGLKPAIGKALAVLKREGWEGVRRRLQTLHAQALSSVGDAGGFDRNDYTEWIRRYDTLTDKTRAAMRAHIDTLAHTPLISVVMATYNPKPEWLIEAIGSVRKQIYPHWELCIADDASRDQAVRPILERYAKEDERIKIVFRSKNGHISAASNSALELATGGWVALLDHDDVLSEDALFWVADTINQQPEARMIYSDEDKIDEGGKRFSPYFKCDWNLDLFYSQNMFSHLGVYSAALLREIGGFRIGFEGAQDYDLALRCVEKIGPNQVGHIPRVLYHWRMHVESTSQALDAKPYAMLAGERALNEHFERCGVAAKAELIGYGYRVRYALPDVLPMVSLIIPTRNGRHLIEKCIQGALRKTTYPNYEIVIVDNGSDDPVTLDYFTKLQSESNVRILRDARPYNFPALNNAAVKMAHGEVVALLNDDTEVISPDWLSEMVSHALRPEVGAVGARLWYPNDTLQHGGVLLAVGGVANHAHYKAMRGMLGYCCRASLTQGFSAVTAACLVIRKSIYEEVGGLNEADLPIAFNDVDFCLRVREAGYRILWTPFAELYHREAATRGAEDTPEKQARFAKEVAYMHRRWGDQLLNDPAYSPNLTLEHPDFSLAWPPRTEPFTHRKPSLTGPNQASRRLHDQRGAEELRAKDLA